MSNFEPTRRDLLAITAAGAISQVVQASTPPAEENPASRLALEKLKEGNQRFVDGKTRHAHQSADWRKHLIADQAPSATILGCADSRVPPELVFDQGFGDLFVVRVAGNVVAPDVVGSLEYAFRHLHCPLFVVLGHQSCGAVTAALDALTNRKEKEPEGIEGLLKLIEPALKDIDPKLTRTKRVAAGVEANVRRSVKLLHNIPGVKVLVLAKKVMIVGAVYNLETGAVRFLDS